MLKEFFTTNLILKATALAIAIAIWLIAQHRLIG
jgi:hypothetical protein